MFDHTRATLSFPAVVIVCYYISEVSLVGSTNPLLILATQISCTIYSSGLITRTSHAMFSVKLKT